MARTIPAANRLVVLGHSLGGVVALALASGWFGVRVSALCGLGIKVAWTDAELACAQTLSTRPNPLYATRGEAAERHLRLAGLSGLLAPDTVGDAALVHGDDGWSIAFDPAAFAVGAPDMASLLSASRATVVLAAGEHDHMCRGDQLRALVANPVILAGLGHNAHVEAPERSGLCLSAWPASALCSEGFLLWHAGNRSDPSRIPTVALVVGRQSPASALDSISCSSCACPSHLKGKAEPLPVFAVRGVVRPRAVRLEEPTYILPMVSRVDEPVLATATLTRALAGQGQLLGITAEAGMGKSRLLAEIVRLATRAEISGYAGACQSFGTTTP